MAWLRRRIHSHTRAIAHEIYPRRGLVGSHPTRHRPVHADRKTATGQLFECVDLQRSDLRR